MGFRDSTAENLTTISDAVERHSLQTANGGTAGVVRIEGERRRRPNSDQSITTLPSYGVPSFATNAHLAGRIIARQVSKTEYDELVDEHRILSIKKVTGTTTRTEDRRLAMVRWNIDRIEDAMYGAELDGLEAIAAAQERLARDVKALVAWSEDEKKPARGPNRGRR